MMRVTFDGPAGGLTFEELTVVADGGLALSGGVVARPCTEGMRILAGGVGALYALDVYEEWVDVTPLPVPGAAGRRIDGVARIGDAQVGAPASGTTDTIVPRVDARSLQVRTSVRYFAVAPRFGIAARRQGDALYATADGVVAHELPDGGAGAVRTFAGSRLRWPTTSLDGWLFVAGADLLAHEEAPTMPGTDVVSVSPATSSAGAPPRGPRPDPLGRARQRAPRDQQQRDDHRPHGRGAVPGDDAVDTRRPGHPPTGSRAARPRRAGRAARPALGHRCRVQSRSRVKRGVVRTRATTGRLPS
ncbi:MAG: hypothetical protein AB1730_24175 [Myxococcota bacterium]